MFLTFVLNLPLIGKLWVVRLKNFEILVRVEGEGEGIAAVNKT
jgi:hypothetical protein